MSLLKIDFYSKTLNMDTTINLMLPEEKWRVTTTALYSKLRGAGDGTFPVLYLLHGTSGDYTDWQRYTSVERYANEKGLAIVSASAQLSGYANMVYGERFFDFIAHEVPEFVKKYFPISRKREDTFIAGYSMGGYGALKVGLALPEDFSVIGAISNGNHAYIRKIQLELKAANPMPKALLDNRHRLCYGLEPGETMIGTEHDIYVLAQRNLDRHAELPVIFHTIGTSDRNLATAVHMRDFFLGIEGNPYHYTYFEEPYRDHTWDFWDKWVKIFIDWLPVKSRIIQS